MRVLHVGIAVAEFLQYRRQQLGHGLVVVLPSAVDSGPFLFSKFRNLRSRPVVLDGSCKMLGVVGSSLIPICSELGI